MLLKDKFYNGAEIKQYKKYITVFFMTDKHTIYFSIALIE